MSSFSISILILILILIYIIVAGSVELYTKSTNSCCSCPSVSCNDINKATHQAREALEEVVPGKWFLVEGTLISALRYGEQCHNFKSGKKNFVDSDIDVYIIIPKRHESRVITQIGDQLVKHGWTVPNMRMQNDGIYNSYAPVHLPSGCYTLSTDKFYIDIHVMYPVEGGFEVGKMEHLWKSFLVDDVLPTSVVYPLAACSWGGGKAYAPSKYLEVLSKWNGNEYGNINGMWKPMESILATGDQFKCYCALSDSDIVEIKNSIRSLKSRGLACFNID